MFRQGQKYVWNLKSWPIAGTKKSWFQLRNNGIIDISVDKMSRWLMKSKKTEKKSKGTECLVANWFRGFYIYLQSCWFYCCRCLDFVLERHGTFWFQSRDFLTVFIFDIKKRH